MHFCLSPYRLPTSADGVSYNPIANRTTRQEVACGRCNACVKNRKQAWVGKLTAEALTSKSVTFVTLTYKKDPEGVFRYPDIQQFLKLLRIHLQRKIDPGARVRFFAIGEYGDEKGRVHWHLMLFFNRPWRMPVPEMNELSEFWPHGWANVQNLRDHDLVVGKIRYCVSYAVKTVGRSDAQRPRMSLKPALGTVYLLRMARDTAIAGLAPSGDYLVPGMVFTRGPRAGMKQPVKVRGSQIRKWIKRYRAAWRIWHPGIAMPVNDWLRHYDPDFIETWIDKPRLRNDYSFDAPVRWRAKHWMSARAGVADYERYLREEGHV